MSNQQTHHSKSHRQLRNLPLNIQMAVRLVASVLRRMVARQEQLGVQDKGKNVKLEQANL